MNLIIDVFHNHPETAALASIDSIYTPALAWQCK